MKIAIVSDDGQTISRHFGRAETYITLAIDEGQIVSRKVLPKVGVCHSASRRRAGQGHEPDARGRGFGWQSESKHRQMMETIKDCDVMLAGGLGRGAYLQLQELGIKPIITDIPDIESAVQALLDNTIINHTEWLH